MDNRIIHFLLLSLLIVSCTRDDEQEGRIDPVCVSDIAGNLMIKNQITDTLYLYTDEITGYTLHKKVAGDSEVLVAMNSDDKPITLLLWKKSEVDDMQSPDLGKVYRIWNTVLPSSYSVQDRVEWTVKEAEAVRTGTLKLDYQDEDAFGQRVIYNVDVVLDFPNSSPIVSIYPGTKNKIIPVPYGVYTVYFKYWFSNPNDIEHIEEIGEISTDGDGNQFRLILSSNFTEESYRVPVFLNSYIGKYGQLIVNNETAGIVLLKANDRLIEEFNTNSNSSSTATSYIPDNEQAELMVDEGEYTIAVYRDQDDSEVLSLFSDYTVLERYPGTIKLGDDADYNEMVVINRTSQPITIHDEEGNYLGSYIYPADQRVVRYDVDGTLEARGYWSGGTKTFPTGISLFTINELE